ncbi:MAG: META domain-containing protein [Sphingobacteriaceae bacterium]
MKLLSFFLCGLSIFFSGCGTKNQMPNAAIVKKHWKLITVGTMEAPQVDAYIIFGTEPGRLRGKAGCNTIGGRYQVRGAEIKITEIFGTKMACPDLEIENAFTKALEAADRYAVNKETLELFSGNNLLATLNALPL